MIQGQGHNFLKKITGENLKRQHQEDMIESIP